MFACPILFLLLPQPRFDEPTQEQLSRHVRLRLKVCQHFLEPFHGEVEPLGEFLDRHGMPFFGRSFVGLGDLGLQVGQQIGRYLPSLDGAGNAM